MKRDIVDTLNEFLKELKLENAEQIGEMTLVLHEGIVVTYPMSLTPSGIDSAKETAKEMIETSMKR
jgi:hypothetical protein